MQSTGSTGIIEMKASAGLVVKKTDGSPFLGILNNPVIKATTEATDNGLSNILSVVELGNNQSNTPLYFKDSNNNAMNVTVNIPVAGGYVGQSVKIYYSHDGATWSPHETTTTTLKNFGGKVYAQIETTHATMFAIGTSTGSFVINGDDTTTSSVSTTLNISAQ